MFRRFFVFTGVLTVLAGWPGVALAAMTTCSVPEAPEIKVNMATDEIKYHFGAGTETLDKAQSGTVSPYAAGADQATGGLRVDKPEINTSIEWNVQYDQKTQVGCMWYDAITITIHLKPEIYVAKEFNQGQCREAIIGHELRHVDVDRVVMNKYAVLIGKAVQAAVNNAGALGPFNMAEVERMKSVSTRHIESAIDSQGLLMQKEMQSEQGKIDSLEEYKRVSGFCKDVKLKN